MIVVKNLTKRFGDKMAVDDVSLTLQPGTVTGFLGPNGAGKSTTMRMILGLDRPDGGSVSVNGRPFAKHVAPMTEVGSLLDASAVNPRRSARSHLRMLAAMNGIGIKRVIEVMEFTGVAPAARRRIGEFSLGMRQRLGIAGSLLGDPHTVLLDEPVNGLDPEGVLWLRLLLRSLAEEGRAVLLSSHLISEVAQTSDRIVVLGRGRILADAPIADFLTTSRNSVTRVHVSNSSRVAEMLRADGATVVATGDETLNVEGYAPAQIARLVAASGADLHQLAPHQSSLEDAYLALTDQAVEYRGSATPSAHPRHGATT